MKTDMTQELKSALDKCEAIEAALIKERKFLEDSATELHALQHTIEVSDLAQVQRMTTLLTIAQVGGTRRTYGHQELETARTVLIAANTEFAKRSLAPRCQQHESRALAKVEGKLKPHFPDEDALRRAAFESKEMSALVPIQ
jgi:hypothetical protein